MPMISAFSKLVLLFIIAHVSSALNSPDPVVHTVSSVALISGKEGTLTCNYNRTVFAVKWRYESTTSPMELLVALDNYYDVGKRSGLGYVEGRFDMTDDYALIIHDVQATDEGKYICEVVDLETGSAFSNHTDVTTVVLAKRPFVRIEQCEDKDSADEITELCFLHTTSGDPNIELTCTVVSAKPMVDLTWEASVSSAHWKQTMNELILTTRDRGNGVFDQTLTLIVNASYIKSNKQHFTCVGKGLAVDGMANYTIAVYPAQGQDNGQGSNVTHTVVITVVCTLLFTFVIIGVLWTWRRVRDKRGSQKPQIDRDALERKEESDALHAQIDRDVLERKEESDALHAQIDRDALERKEESDALHAQIDRDALERKEESDALHDNFRSTLKKNRRMDQADRDSIRTNIGVLSDDMDFESVSTFLYSKCIFEKGHIEEFAANKNQKMRNLELLLAIEARGPEAFRCLVEALLAAEQPFLAEKLGRSTSNEPDHYSQNSENQGANIGKMDPADRKTIKRNIVVLSSDMDFVRVTASLLARDIFEIHHIQRFEAKPSKRERNMALLMDIETRGPRAFASLVESLIEANQEDLAQRLGYTANSHGQMGYTQATTPHENRPAPFGQPTHIPQAPPVWPPRDNSGDYSSTQNDALTSYPQSMVDSDMVYKMKSKPRGIALIINNKIFKTMKKRTGTDVDCRNLENVFKQLGFHVVIHRDLKGRDIQQMIQQLRRHNHSQFDCFILAVLTHGIEGAIYGTDEYLVRIEDIVGQFSSDRCPTLNGKPKLFFLAADRGERFDDGVEIDDSAADFKMSCKGDYFFNHKPDAKLDDDELVDLMLKTELDATHSFASTRSKMPSRSDVLLAYATVPERFDDGIEADDSAAAFKMSCKGDYFFNHKPDAKLDDDKHADLMLKMELEGTDSFASTRSKIPGQQSDMLLAYATIPGFVAWRNSERGTWFIQALTEVMIQYAKTEDLLSMMTMVNGRVARAFESSSGRFKQMPAPVSMLTKKLYFFPAHYE